MNDSPALVSHFCLFFILLTGCDRSQKEQLTVHIADAAALKSSTLVSLKIKGDFTKDMVLYKKIGENVREVPYQIEKERMWFTYVPVEGMEVPHYFLEQGHSVANGKFQGPREDNGNLLMYSNEKPVLSYRYGMTYPPNGVDSIFKKSGYIHPLRSPKGDTLSRIQPPDHWHHYGLWGPWTHTRIDTTRVDFWNLGEGMGTVLFKAFKGRSSGPVFSSFTAAQEHIDFKTREAPQVALNEDLKVRLWNLNRPDRYMFDYTTSFDSPLENGILFEAYRYGGGLGMRFNKRWKADNCTVLTSAGKDRSTADGSNARWCIVKGESSDKNGTNGILFMSHPENRSHPEPMRIWPLDANEGRGDMFFEFCPIRHKEWKIEPDKIYELKYRMVVFEGELKPEEAETYWHQYANPTMAEIKIKNPTE